jgi:hypothetical protein
LLSDINQVSESGYRRREGDQLHHDSSDIDNIIKELDRDPERQDRIRRTGVTQALLRHDWVYRWEAILQAAGLEPMQGARERKNRLKRLAEAVPKTVTMH